MASLRCRLKKQDWSTRPASCYCRKCLKELTRLARNLKAQIDRAIKSGQPKRVIRNLKKARIKVLKHHESMLDEAIALIQKAISREEALP